MILPTHALVGAVIGKNIGTPWLIIPAALISHYVLDSFRHGDYVDDRLSIRENSWKISLDVLAALITTSLVIYFLGTNQETSINIILGIILSLLPDFLTLLGKLFPKSKIFVKTRELNAFAHRYDKNPKYSPERQWNLRNAANDIIISCIAIIILLVL